MCHLKKCPVREKSSGRPQIGAYVLPDNFHNLANGATPRYQILLKPRAVTFIRYRAEPLPPKRLDDGKLTYCDSLAANFCVLKCQDSSSY